MSTLKIDGETFSQENLEDMQSKFNDKNALGFAWRPGQKQYALSLSNCEINGSGVSEGLKLSFCRNVYVDNCTIFGGYEDCVDIVRGENITFKNCKFISQKSKQHITAKGGVKNLSFINCTFVNSFSKFYDGACIDLGNWTDYDDVDRPMVRNVLIQDCRMDNVATPILYRRLYSETPKVKNSSGFKFNIPKIFVKMFWYGQRNGLLGPRRRFDPSWLEVYDFEK